MSKILEILLIYCIQSTFKAPIMVNSFNSTKYRYVYPVNFTGNMAYYNPFAGSQEKNSTLLGALFCGSPCKYSARLRGEQVSQ